MYGRGPHMSVHLHTSTHLTIERTSHRHVPYIQACTSYTDVHLTQGWLSHGRASQVWAGMGMHPRYGHASQACISGAGVHLMYRRAPHRRTSHTSAHVSHIGVHLCRRASHRYISRRYTSYRRTSHRYIYRRHISYRRASQVHAHVPGTRPCPRYMPMSQAHARV